MLSQQFKSDPTLLFGWAFALIFLAGTIALGLTAGAVTDLLERTAWLAGQARMHDTGCLPATCPAPARVISLVVALLFGGALVLGGLTGAIFS